MYNSKKIIGTVQLKRIKKTFKGKKLKTYYFPEINLGLSSKTERRLRD